MNIRKIPAAIAVSLSICAVCASCGSKKSEKSLKSSDYATKTIISDAPDANEGSAVAAASGQAYLEIRDALGNSQYLGGTDDNLCYNAVVADIKGNGSYTVSVTADSDEYRTKVGGNPDNYNVNPKGLMYSALKIKDGVNACPGAVLTIDSIEVDGTEIPLAAKNVTFTEDNKDLKSNIYNEWASKIPDNAVSAEGAVPDGTPGYSAVIVSKDAFESWTTVKVNFTVSGME